ncbi:MAG: hypothetical protein KAH56_13205 [Candidatus Krumholzibacteria bacterium]|nr:hypothetical protein [Candidatus Krumholzibacteria bacterium]
MVKRRLNILVVPWKLLLAQNWAQNWWIFPKSAYHLIDFPAIAQVFGLVLGQQQFPRHNQ